MLIKSCVAAGLVALACCASAETVTGIVVGVTDGDTVTLLDSQNRSRRVRLAAIDAPERNQAFGQRAKQALSELAYRRRAQADCHKTDRYRRDVCYVFVDGQDVGLEMIRRGLAWHYRQYAGEQTADARSAYARAEAEAVAARRGLWRDPDPVPPSEWRKRKPVRRP